jgi:hypothetical protein
MENCLFNFETAELICSFLNKIYITEKVVQLLSHKFT